MFHRPGQRHSPAQALTQDDGPLGPQLARGRHQHRRLFRQAGPLRRNRVGIAQARPVEGDDAVAFGQRADHVIGEIAQIARGAVDQHKIRPLALHQRMDPLAIHLDELPRRGIGAFRRRLVPGRAPQGQRGKPRQKKDKNSQDPHQPRRSVRSCPMRAMS